MIGPGFVSVTFEAGFGGTVELSCQLNGRGESLCLFPSNWFKLCLLTLRGTLEHLNLPSEWDLNQERCI